MAEQEATTTAESNPNGLSRQMTFEDATKHVSGMLAPEGTTNESETAPQETNEEEPESPEIAEPETSESEETSQETQPSEAETEPVETETEAEAELPDTLQGLAEALDMQPEELAGHIKVPIKLDGASQEVTLAEAQNGYMRQADFTQKTQALAAEREKVSQQLQQAGQLAQQRLSELDAAIQAVEGLVDDGYTEEQLAELLEYNPGEYVKLTERKKARQEKITEAKDKIQKERDEALKVHGEQMMAYREQQQQQLLDKLPHLKDPQKLQVFEREARDYLISKGFPEEAVSSYFNGVFDARQIDIMSDAMKYRAMQKGSKKLTKELKGKGLPKPLKPGAAKSRTSGEGERRAKSLENLRRASKRGTKAQQKAAGVEFVKNLLD